MAKPQLRGGGVEVDGLAESIRAIGRWDKAVRKEAVEIFRDEAKTVQARAKANARAHPSSPSSTSWIGRSATGKGAGVKLIARKGDWRAHSSEWGKAWWHIRAWPHNRARHVPQNRMSRRTFQPWEGSQFKVSGKTGPGYVIQPAIRSHLPGMADRVADKLSRLLSRELDRAGVKRG